MVVHGAYGVHAKMSGVTPMPSKDGMNYSPSSGVTMEPNVMTLEEAVDAGLVTPTRPRMRPAAPMQHLCAPECASNAIGGY